MAQTSNPFDQQTSIPGVKSIIAVSSGKGGVGKSTVSVNLALALADMGVKTGLLDADIYGPSIPRMMGLLNQKPEVNEKKRILPLERYGVRVMSIGFLVEEDLAVVWRGPMLFKAMNQFLHEVDWGELDILIVDLPPGTGDVQLSLVQKVPVQGAISVCTPQNLALADVKKSIDMFERTGVRILGVVENMSSFTPPGQSQPIQLFPKGQLDDYLKQKNLEKLAEIPFDPQLGQAAEMGVPASKDPSKSPAAAAFRRLAEQVRELSKRKG